MFVSLGFDKRYAELYEAVKSGDGSAHGRGYRGEDLPLLLTLGVAVGYCIVLDVLDQPRVVGYCRQVGTSTTLAPDAMH